MRLRLPLWLALLADLWVRVRASDTHLSDDPVEV